MSGSKGRRSLSLTGILLETGRAFYPYASPVIFARRAEHSNVAFATHPLSEKIEYKPYPDDILIAIHSINLYSYHASFHEKVFRTFEGCMKQSSMMATPTPYIICISRRLSSLTPIMEV